MKNLIYLTNAFSLGMLSGKCTLEVEELPTDRAVEELKEKGFISFISHQSTAQVLSELLGREVPFNRANLKLKTGDELIVFQLLKRLKEGQVFSRKELEEILQEDYFTFFKVKVF
ncbi:MAG: DUF1874 domain-containing protein [Aquificae bacterium]|nr:DUF1874 domain-containing protein [Aquificota bacterium]